MTTGVVVRLGVDFGTSNTVAVVAVDGREPRPLLFDGSPLLPSAVCAEVDGRLLVGRDARHTGLTYPGAFEPYPKRCIDDETVLLGEVELPAERLIAAVLRRVAEEAERAAGTPVTETVLTCPAAWGAQRRGVLLGAARDALPGTVRLAAEPVAAAARLIEAAGDRFAPGAHALVYDFGAGTFDASVVRRTAGGIEVLATKGLTDSGGLDVDAAIVAYAGTALADRDPALWARLITPETLADRRASRQLWENVRTGKEMLARSSTTVIHMPLLDADVPLGREELDRLAGPVLDRTVEASRAALRTAGIEPAELTAIMLAGGSSRMPAVSTALHRAFGSVPVAVDQPELVVAEGSLRVDAASGAPVTAEPATGESWPTAQLPTDESAPISGPAPMPGAAPTDGPASAPVGSVRSRRRLLVLAAAAAVAVAVAVPAVLVAMSGSDPSDEVADGGERVAAGVSQTATPEPTASPTPSVRAGLDPCLIGTWRRVSSERTLTIDGKPVQFTGKVDVVETYRADGTLRITFGAEPPGVAWVNGVKWAEHTEGSGTVSWRVTNDGHILFSNPKVKGNWKLTRNGKYNNGGKLTLSVKPVQYVCSEDTYVAVSDFYSIQAKRVVESP
ncbi:Hsp70 family protein [Solwaraspora sp. WMMD1047]|uniref:Hsp70 family protein n=1 Tax=Solwaraspora sp. WMMD1047 TaxID=3016102 RepID=UPI002416B33B|nr:Hsp70 family protein [Solwaraspora sp. WMMD1047]MDG4833446.1 Hsp70 family protein [Solwaraspora sp. WMMD1047]